VLLVDIGALEREILPPYLVLRAGKKSVRIGRLKS